MWSAENVCVGFCASVLEIDTLFTSLENLLIYYTVFTNGCKVKMDYELWVGVSEDLMSTTLHIPARTKAFSFLILDIRMPQLVGGEDVAK